MSNYESERYIPKIPSCVKSDVYLEFDGNNLKFFTKNQTVKLYIYPAASGKPIKGKFDYSANNQKQPFQGPIPEGEYWITLSELWENAWYKPGSEDAWGEYRIAIHPYPNTNTYGRGGFFIHGGTILGSAGCIDLTKGINTFVKNLRATLIGKQKCYVPLTIRYSK